MVDSETVVDVPVRNDDELTGAVVSDDRPQSVVSRIMPSRDSIPTTKDLLSTTPIAIWIIVILTTLVGVLGTIFYPAFRGADEVAHTGLVISVADRSVEWRPGTMHLQNGINRPPLTSTRLTEPMHLDDNSLPPRSERQTYEELGGSSPASGINWMVQHPPLYYFMTGSLLGIIPHWQSMPVDRILLVLRLLTVLIIVPIPWSCYAAARTLGSSQNVGMVAALTPLLIPEFEHVLSTVNNDALLALLGAAVIWQAARVLRGDLTLRTAFRIGLLCAAISLTKGFGLMLVLLVVLVYLIALYRGRIAGKLLRSSWSCIIGLGVPLAIGSVGWIGNVVQYHILQPNGYLTSDQQHPATQPSVQTVFADSSSPFVRAWLDDFSQRFWFDDPTGVQSTTYFTYRRWS